MNMLPDMPDRFCICLYFHVHIVDVLTVNTTCNFEKEKLIIGNNSEKNRLDLRQVQKHSNMILLVVFLLTITSLNALPSYPTSSIFKYFLADTHTHRHDSIALPLLRMHMQGNDIPRVTV